MLKIPHLKTALVTPLFELEKICLANQYEIEHWFREQWLNNKVPFYGSVDLRNSNYKLTPIDMNLFSGGFNNIHQKFIPLATHAINNLIERYCPHATKILLIPENHTRNNAYLKNVYTLNFILEQAGLHTRIGSLSSEITEKTRVDISETVSMTYYPIKRDGNRITTQDGFDPCLILLNNDLSAGSPAILENIQQKIMPPLNAGWHTRRKTHFFTQYDKICNDFAKLVNIDPWIINAFFDIETGLNFTTNVGLDRLAIKVNNIIEKIQKKYKEHGIIDTPYVIVKANNGTYGMGIMSVKSGDEIINMNRKSRNKMAVIKDGQSVTDVIIQEGVYSFEQINGHTAEPVIYMMGCSVIGGFYRVNAKKGIDENLNSVGAHFIPMSLASKCLCSGGKKADKSPPNRFYTYSVIARLALLASSMEIEIYK